MKMFLCFSLVCLGFITSASAKVVEKRTPSNAASATSAPNQVVTLPIPAKPGAPAPSTTAAGTAVVTQNPSITASNPTPTPIPLTLGVPFSPMPLIHLSTNFVDFTQGKSNFVIDFFSFKKKLQVNVRSYSSSEQETLETNGLKYTVVRSALGLGFSWYAHDITASRNWVISPALVFGKTDDPFQSTSQAGIGLKATALYRIGDRSTFEVGMLSDTIHASHRNALHLAFGYFL